VIDDEQEHEYSINPEMIWAVRVGEDEIKIYISEESTLTFSQLALDLLGDAIDPFRT
jgi:hypothetical protein